MTEAPNTIEHWLPIYMERFGESITFDIFQTEADAVSAIKEALKENKQIETPKGVIIW